MKRSADAEQVRYRNKETQSGTGMLQYRTGMLNAGMKMPAASASMSMPFYAIYVHKKYNASRKLKAKSFRTGGLQMCHFDIFLDLAFL
jgi:hypothetical protein